VHVNPLPIRVESNPLASTDYLQYAVACAWNWLWSGYSWLPYLHAESLISEGVGGSGDDRDEERERIGYEWKDLGEPRY
jgi:hypothetical protein